MKTTSTKTPYEIRLELLQMAQAHLHNTAEQQLNFMTKFMEKTQLAGIHTLQELQKAVPKSYSIEDIIAKANELYAFVQKKD